VQVIVVVAVIAGILALWGGSASAAWQPTKPVEFNVPAGTGGGPDIMARFLSPLFEKNKATEQPWIVVNPSASA
jgi:tripartite-type tricarboxylate transporter receptor subunit TctC